MPRRLFAAFSLGGLLVLVQPVIVHVIQNPERASGTNPQASGVAHAVPVDFARVASIHPQWASQRNMTVIIQSQPAPGSRQGVLLGSGTEGLPAPVAAMRQAMLDAAGSGFVEEMREVIELSEIKPEFGPEVGSDPIADWKKLSSDGQGREILAAVAAILQAGWARRPVAADGRGRAMYVWPYLAEIPLRDLSPAQDADLRRLVPGPDADAMRRSGRYTYWTLGIAEDGTWHYFVLGQ